MVETYAIAKWTSFFSTLAGVSATLAGLLFVSVSLRHRILNTPEFAAVKRLALHTFRSFLFLVVLSMTFLIPESSRYGSGLPLACIGFGALLSSFRLLQQDSRHVAVKLVQVPKARYAYIISLLTYLGVIVSAVALMFDYSYSIYFVVGFLIWNLARATESAWALLGVDDH